MHPAPYLPPRLGTVNPSGGIVPGKLSLSPVRGLEEICTLTRKGIGCQADPP